MSRLIQEKVKQPLAEELLFGKLAHGGEVHVSVKEEALTFELTPAPPKLVKKKAKVTNPTAKAGRKAPSKTAPKAEPEPSADE
jgi:ATP-dependent Clp protease ATP-binding subunit ClpA